MNTLDSTRHWKGRGILSYNYRRQGLETALDKEHFRDDISMYLLETSLPIFEIEGFVAATRHIGVEMKVVFKVKGSA